MSDQPPSGPTEPVSPATSGASLPADPTSPPPPAAEPAGTAGPEDRPTAPGPSTPTGGGSGPAGPAHPGQPGFAVPGGQPGFAAPGGQPGFTAPGGPGQPGMPYPTESAGGQPQGWVWPAAGGPAPAGPYPGHPPMPGQPYAWYPGGPGWDPGDPLVTPPHAGVGGWFSRCGGALRRGWQLLLPIMLLTQAVPAGVVSVIGLALMPSGQPTTGADGAPVLPESYLRDALAFYAVLLVASLVLGLLQNLGWAAGTWVVTRQAAGEPVGLGAAFRYGARRALGLWGWSLLGSLLIGVGVCFCVLPGLYAAFALALLGPVYLFERHNPIGRSFQIFHQRLGMVLGRVALVAAAVVVGGLVGFLLRAVGQLAFGEHPMDAPGTAAGAVGVAVVAAVLTVPVYLVQLVGLVATYAEQRAHEGPVNAARLAAELG